MLICFIFLLFSCITDKIDEDTSTRTDEEDGVICFKSSETEFDNWNTKSGENKQILPCTPAQWGQISAEVSPIDDRRTTKGTPISLVTNIANAGVFSYVTVGSSFNSSSSTGSTPNYMYNQQITQTGGVWSYTPKKYWPTGATTKTSFFAYSPYASGTNGITPSTNTIKGTPYLTYTMPSTVANQPDLMIASQINLTSGTVNFGFKHAFAFVGFAIQGNSEQVKSIGIQGMSISGQLSLDGTAITWSNLGTASTSPTNAGINYDAGQSYVTATSTQIPAGTLMQSNGYLMVIPQTLTASTILVVTFNDNSTKQVAINNSTPTWVAGNKYIYAITLQAATSNTSNCFIISPSTTGSKTVLLDVITRVNHFWADAAGGGFGGGDGDGYVALGNSAANAIGSTDQWYFSKIWADFAGHTNITIKQRGTTDGGVNGTGTTENLELTLAAGTYTGNLVIGVKKSGGTNYLWSFHLWVTSYDPSLSTNQGTMPSGLVVMDRNLGATAGGTKGSVGALGLLYQWGRKDPFTGSSNYTTSSEVVLAIGSMNRASNGTLLNCVYNPNTRYLGGSPNFDAIGSGDLTGSTGFNRWGGNTNNTTATALKNKKSIYDPCPKGWRLPWGLDWGGIGAYTSASTPVNFQFNSTEKGRIYTGSTPNIFFPATGLFTNSGTILNFTGTSGMYWSGTSSVYVYGSALEITDLSGNGALTAFRGATASVRATLDN